MSTATLQMHIDLAGISGRVQRLLKQATYLVAIGVRSGESIAADSFRLPGLTFAHEFDHTNPWSVDEAKSAWHSWVLTNGFRDVAEIVAGTLEEVQGVLAIWRLLDPVNPSTLVKASDWNTSVARRAEQFHRRTLPQKLEFLASHYSFTLPDDHLSEIKSINAARNCFVHRGGQVTDVDTDESRALILKWRHLQPIIVENGVATELILPYVTEKETMLGLRVAARERRFEIGSYVELELQDFSEICWTLFLFAQCCGTELEAYGRSKGFTIAQRAA